MTILIFWITFYAMTGMEVLILIPFLINKKLLDSRSRWIFYYIISSLIFAVGSDLLRYIYQNNMWFFNCMHFIQFLILTAFYKNYIKNRILQKIIMFMPLVVAGVFALDAFVIEGISAYNSISAGVKSILLLIYGALFFLQMLNDKDLIERSIYIDSLPEFWYNAGLFIFYCSVFFFNISFNLLQKIAYPSSQLNVVLTILSINNVVGVISMILLYIGFSKLKKLRYADS